MTTAALTVPIVLLRRQRSRAVSNSLLPRRIGDRSTLTSRFTPISSQSPSLNESQWPPPRRAGKTSSLGSRFPPRAGPNLGSGSLLGAKELEALKERSMANDGFNAPLYTVKAFGIATLIVTMCATTVVWGVKTTMGVKDVRPPISVLFHGHSSSNLHLIIFW